MPLAKEKKLSKNGIFGIRALIGLIPGVALIIGAGLLFWYPLKGKYLDEVKDKMMLLHAKKRAQLME